VNSRTFFRDFWELLAPLSFELRRICPGGKTTVVKSYYEDLEPFRGVTNYVAILRVKNQITETGGLTKTGSLQKRPFRGLPGPSNKIRRLNGFHNFTCAQLLASQHTAALALEE
jgi:hypothetical protein